MGRAADTTKDSLRTAAARRRLPSLVKNVGAKKKPSSNLLEDAVDIAPHRKGGAVLIPKVDVIQSERVSAQLRRDVQDLEDDLDDLGLLMVVQERLAAAGGPDSQLSSSSRSWEWRSSLPSSRKPDEYRFEFLAEVAEETKHLEEDVRRAIATVVVDLHHNHYLGELMDDRWPQNLEGARKVRLDVAGWHGKPRYRLVYRNEPTDGAVDVMVVLAIGRRDKTIAYAKASARLARRTASEKRPNRRPRLPETPE